MNVAVSEEEFNKSEVGDNWIPQYDYMLFKKEIDIKYNCDRQK